jgi:hypothetical protein
MLGEEIGRAMRVSTYAGIFSNGFFGVQDNAGLHGGPASGSGKATRQKYRRRVLGRFA